MWYPFDCDRHSKNLKLGLHVKYVNKSTIYPSNVFSFEKLFIT
jgi:hypothetical protein